MKTNGKWFVMRSSDDRILCTDGKWRHNCGCIERIKMWSKLGWVERTMRRLGVYEWTATCLYPGDVVDCLGNVERLGGR